MVKPSILKKVLQELFLITRDLSGSVVDQQKYLSFFLEKGKFGRRIKPTPDITESMDKTESTRLCRTKSTTESSIYLENRVW